MIYDRSSSLIYKYQGYLTTGYTAIWAASTSYTLGDIVRLSTSSTAFWQCVRAGTSGTYAVIYDNREAPYGVVVDENVKGNGGTVAWILVTGDYNLGYSSALSYMTDAYTKVFFNGQSGQTILIPDDSSIFYYISNLTPSVINFEPEGLCAVTAADPHVASQYVLPFSVSQWNPNTLIYGMDITLATWNPKSYNSTANTWPSGYAAWQSTAMHYGFIGCKVSFAVNPLNGWGRPINSCTYNSGENLPSEAVFVLVDCLMKFGNRRDSISITGRSYIRNLSFDASSAKVSRLFSNREKHGDNWASTWSARILDSVDESAYNTFIRWEDQDFSSLKSSQVVMDLTPFRPAQVEFNNVKFRNWETAAPVYGMGLGCERRVTYESCGQIGDPWDPFQFKVESNLFRVVRQYSVVRSGYPSVNEASVAYSMKLETPAYLTLDDNTRVIDSEFSPPSVGPFKLVFYVLSKTVLKKSDFWVNVMYGVGGPGTRNHKRVTTADIVTHWGNNAQQASTEGYPAGVLGDWVNAPVDYIPYQIEVQGVSKSDADLCVSFFVGGPNLVLYFDPVPDFKRVIYG